MYGAHYFGFSAMDEGIMGLLTCYISEKMSELDQIIQCHEKDQSLISTHDYISKLLENKTIEELIIYIRENLGRYLGYEFSGLLFLSEKSITLINNRQRIVHLLLIKL